MLHQAMPRKKPARPIIWLIKNNLINGNILHYGRGKDIAGTQILSKTGTVTEYDPNVPKINDRMALAPKYDAVVSCFVLNCLRSAERDQAIIEMAKATNGSAFIAVRSAKDPNLKIKQRKWAVAEDGFTNFNKIRSSIKTSTPHGALFQKFYEPEDLIVELKKCFLNAFILYAKGHFIIAQATNIKLPKRSAKYDIGKQMIGCIYVHRSSEQILPGINKAKKYIPKNHDYSVVKFNWFNNTFSFIQSPDFDTAYEPTVGNSLIVHADGKTKLIKAPRDPWIYHHKWLMVDDNYSGFDVSRSKSRSIAWMKLNPDRSKIGKKSSWLKNILPSLP